MSVRAFDPRSFAACSKRSSSSAPVVQQAGLRHWRRRAREAVVERAGVEKAQQHHRARLLSSALQSWSRHHLQRQKYEVKTRTIAVSQFTFSSVLMKSCTRYTSSVGARVLFQPRERIGPSTDFKPWSVLAAFLTRRSTESASEETRVDSVGLYIPACISRSQVLKY